MISDRHTSDKGAIDKVTSHKGKALSWQMSEGVLELALHLPPCNEIGTAMLGELGAVRRSARSRWNRAPAP